MAIKGPTFFEPAGKAIGFVAQKTPPSSPDVEGPYRELAAQTRRLIGQDTSTRTAALRARVSHDTIARMLKGYRPKEWTLDRISESYRVNPNLLRRAARYAEKPAPGDEAEPLPEEGEEVEISGGMRARVTRGVGRGAEVEITEEVLTILEALSAMQQKN